MTHALLHPWSHGFMQRALLELLFVGVLGAVLGCWIVLYRLAYSAESLAHALFPGLVVAALVGLPLLAGAAGGVAAGAAGVGLATRLPGISRDVAVAVVCALAGLYVSYSGPIAAGGSGAGTPVRAYVVVLALSSLRPRASAASAH